MLGSSRWEPRDSPQPPKRAAIVVDAVCWARDLVNTPAGDMPPAEIAREAQRMARSVGLTCKVWNENQLDKGGFGGILGVGKGSVNPPRLIELTYTGAGTPRRSRSPARASPSTPAGCRSRTPRAWRR